MHLYYTHPGTLAIFNLQILPKQPATAARQLVVEDILVLRNQNAIFTPT